MIKYKKKDSFFAEVEDIWQDGAAEIPMSREEAGLILTAI